MKTLRILAPFLMLLAIWACNRSDQELCLQPNHDGISESDGKSFHNGKPLKIAVLSDLHFMDPSLLKSNGSAFQLYLMQDPKLLAESGAILKELILKLIMEKPDLVIISGDLTKDGELVCHKNLIRQLRILELYHIKILVIPGNHDINNPDAKMFDGDQTYPVASITSDDFKALYADFGYKQALAKDPNSLSYVAEPLKGLRVLAIDANEYYNNIPSYSVVAGRIKDETMAWIKLQLADAMLKGKTVIGMMHHGIIEHFMGESQIFPDYLVNNWQSDADTLIKAGLKVMFTGHFHANDATQRYFNGSSLVDVETGAPVIYDSPYRIFQLANKKLYITTRHIERICYPGLTGISFHNYEKAFSLQGFEIQAKYMLMGAPYSIPESLASQIAPVFADAMLAHFAGDEILTEEAYANIQSVASILPDLGNILLGLYSDLSPTDNELIVDLN